MAEINGPFVQYGPNEKRDPFVDMNPMSTEKKVITRYNTENVRGQYLYLHLNGMNLYVPLSDTMVVDERGKTVVVYNPDDEVLTPATERNYLVLCVTIDDSGGQEYISVTGRQNVFDAIVNMADVLDFQRSLIIAETTKLKDAITVFEFMKMCVDKEIVDNPTGFDPYEYGDYMEE